MKAQAAYSDFIVAIIIVAFMTTAFIYTLSNDNKGTSDDLLQTAAHVSEIVLNKGVPSVWNTSTVKRPGVTDGKWRVNENNIAELYKLDRTKLRALLDTEDNVYIRTFNGSALMNFSGKNFTGRAPSNQRTLTSISRFAILNGTIIEIQIGVWR